MEPQPLQRANVTKQITFKEVNKLTDFSNMELFIRTETNLNSGVKLLFKTFSLILHG